MSFFSDGINCQNAHYKLLVKPDLDCSCHIRRFVESFYAQLLKDERLAPFFIDIAAVDFSEHIPVICQYWEKLLLGERNYSRHTMNIHRTVNNKRKFQSIDFDRWLTLFIAVLESNFEGLYACKAKMIATQIASNMERSFNV